MKSYIISCILSLRIAHFFFKFCFVLESKPSLYVSNNRGKVLQTSKVGLNSKQGFCKSFQTKNQKKTEKKRERI
jgi:hypothetical protein